MSKTVLAATDDSSLATVSPLAAFANLGDSCEDMLAFRADYPEFFTPEFYDTCEFQAVRRAKTFFNWHKQLLKMVWEGRDPDGTRLAVLLGLRLPESYFGPPGGDYLTESAEYLAMVDDLKDAGGQFLAFLPAAELVPSWRSGRVQYRTGIAFQRAVYFLMSQSWRAKICPIDNKFFVAAKPANLYCSDECTHEAKRRRGSEWWRESGKLLQQKKRKARKAARRGK
jgi:hypothetical protein